MRAKQNELPQQNDIPQRQTTPEKSATATAMPTPAEDYSYDEYMRYEDMPTQIETYYVGEEGH